MTTFLVMGSDAELIPVSSQTPSVDPEEAFLAALRTSEVFIDDGMITDGALITLGNSACTVLDEGSGTFDSVVQGMLEMEVAAMQAMSIVDAAVSTLCPQHGPAFDAWVAS